MTEEKTLEIMIAMIMIKLQGFNFRTFDFSFFELLLARTKNLSCTIMTLDIKLINARQFDFLD